MHQQDRQTHFGVEIATARRVLQIATHRRGNQRIAYVSF